MKLKLFILLILFSGILFSQGERRISGILSSTYHSDAFDSTVTFYSAGQEWVYIFLVDSLSTADTVLVGIRNPINNNYTILGVKDQYNEDFVNVMVPGVDVRGKLYIVWVLYPGNIELRKLDYLQMEERISYWITSEGTSQ